MTQQFSFPPPPPPPPRRENHVPSEVRGSFRGRANNRGYGSHSRNPAPNFRGSYGQNSTRGGHDHHGQRHFPPKRDFATAFATQPQSRPRAPPAVPSFDIDVKSLLPAKLAPPPPVTSKRTTNLLGLTPSGQDASESEGDDDEARLAAFSATDGLHFEHKGQKLSLSNPMEVAAWIAERKKKFPTKAKVEAAKRVAEEKQKAWEEQKRAREEAYKLKKAARDQERNERERQQLKEKLLAAQVAKAKSAAAESKDNNAEKARQKAERLRKKAEKAAEELRIAEEQLRQAEMNTIMPESTTTELVDSDSESAIRSPDESGSDETSSSDSSECGSESDSAPEETTSKGTISDRLAPSKQSLLNASRDGPPLCKSMLKYKRCKYGKKCRFSHNIQKEKPKNKLTTSAKRKSLYQVMVEKEQEEMLKQAMKTIISLGDQGVFNEPSSVDTL